MCGRFTLHTEGAQLAAQFGVPAMARITPRYNIAPGQPLAALRGSAAAIELTHLRWGLVPSWAKDPAIGNRLINARAETIAEKPSFRAAFRRRRCLVPADGYYEWRTTATGKQPYYIHARDRQPFAFAGLWEHWQGADGSELETAALVTCGASTRLAAIHDRMPAIIDTHDHATWLDPAASATHLAALLRPAPDDAFDFTPVSRHVNSPVNDDPRCIEPVPSEVLPHHAP
ncbi:MAG: SOS response-associated peptidase [Gammaproteobacteria bacterium]|nr:SOS response-associated peptidase [Gammaproteobacteria bacterium]